MVRTKGDGAVTKVVGSKAPRKQLVSNTSGGSSSTPDGKKKQPGSGLPFCPQPTPDWQKGIKNFFTITSNRKSEEDGSDNEKENVESEVIEVDEKTEIETKGKGSAKGKKSAKKSSKKNEADNEEEGKGAAETAEDNNKSDNENEKKSDSGDEQDEPVKKKKNRIIESDDDE